MAFTCAHIGKVVTRATPNATVIDCAFIKTSRPSTLSDWPPNKKDCIRSASGRKAVGGRACNGKRSGYNLLNKPLRGGAMGIVRSRGEGEVEESSGSKRASGGVLLGWGGGKKR